MAQNYLTVDRQSPVQSLIQGFGAGSNVMNQITRNNLLSEQFQKENLITAMKLHDEMKGMAYDNLDFYNTKYRPTLLKLGVPENLLPEYNDVKELNAGLYRNEQIKAMYKARLEGPKVVPERGAVYEGGQFKYPEISPARQAILENERMKEANKFKLLEEKYGRDQAMEMIRQEHRLRLLNERAGIEKPGSYEMVETDEGPAWSQKGKGDIIPIPGAKRKAKAGGDIEVRSKAMKALSDAGITLDDPKYDEYFEKTINKIKGTKQPESDIYGALNPALKSMKFPRTLRNSDTGETITVNSQEEYNRYMSGR